MDIESVDIDIDSDALKLVHGEVNSVTMWGKGVVTPKNLRLEAVVLQTDSIAINPLSTALGKIELTQPTNTSVRLVVTEADLTPELTAVFRSIDHSERTSQTHRLQ